MDKIDEQRENERLRRERNAVVDAFFTGIPVPSLGEQSVSTILSVLEHPGFILLAGLLKGERNALLLALANTSLADPAKIAQASVLQGRVQGIDSLHTTLIEVANHTASPATETK